MEFEPCKTCEGMGYIEMDAYDLDEKCEECDGLGAIIKKVNPRRVKGSV